MVPSTNLHKGLILYSFTLVAILLWLSVSFLTTSYSDKRDTDFLRYYLEADKNFKKASLAVAKEQSASHWLMAYDNISVSLASLFRPHDVTNEALQELQSKSKELVSLPRYADELKFRREQLQNLVSELNNSVDDIQIHRDLLTTTLDMAAEKRDIKKEPETLQYYSSLVDQIEMLRHASTYVSPQQTRAVQNLLIVSDATWNLALSNELLSGLFESYLTTGKLVKGSINRVNNNLSEIEENFASISLIDSYAGIDLELNTLANELRSWFTSSYKTQVDAIALAMEEGSEIDLSGNEWREVYGRMAELTESIQKRADEITERQVKHVSESATRNFIVDSFLVILSIIFAIISIWFVKRVQHQATHDVLTGLPNRRLFVTHCDNLVSPETSSTAALIKVDISKFKSINDSIGQFAGDEILQQVADRLRASFSQASLISRLGSDEFSILLKDNSDQELCKVADSVVDVLSGQYQLSNNTVSLKVCVGYACAPADAVTGEDLVKAADLALNESKRAGPGNVIYFKPSIANAFKKRQQLESELEFALQRGEFELHYQPQVSVQKQVVDGVEALIRWRHPIRGLVSPFHFLPVAEDAGLLPAIGEWVINQAARQSAIWKRDFGLDLRVSVNVSAHQFVEGDLVETVRLALAEDELNPASFEIEITESVAMFDLKTVVSKLNELHKTGVRIALDDFGTGYSSLSYIQDLPLDTLKIDRSFVNKLDNATGTQNPLLESIALMAKRLDLHTVAEGVETDSQLEQVCALGIDTIQGYYYSKPVTASQLPDDVKAIDAACSLGRAA